ncbi:MAG: GSU2203 family decaheme c-type cytochrome [Desulfuromonadales bacterium]|nr:GSU2203 family decaheme c-type cytochrome [Desulfuromonadales bacterium]
MHRKVSLSRTSWLVKLLPLLLFLGACATGAIREKQLTLPVIDGATSVGQEACAECHEGMSAGVHSRLAGFEYMGGTEGCEACHGGGSLHVNSDGDQILKFGELLPEESAAICAKCHADGKLIDWTHSEHALTDVGCTDCHSVHAGGKTALKQQDPELCYSCHQEQQAKANFPSHHPIKEGKMNCGDCHNPHGELNTVERTNDLCLDCHSRYQGPFVFGHAPVEDDCTICHDPHGSVANNMLVQNEPFLCLQCHEGHFHILRKGFDPASGNYTTPGANPTPNMPGGVPAGATVPAKVDAANPHGVEGWQMSFGTKCTTCHAVVHGSDLPSQPLTGGGLTR